MNIKLTIALIYYKVKMALVDEALEGLIDIYMQDVHQQLTEDDVVSLYINLIGWIPKDRFFLLTMEVREEVKAARELLDKEFNNDSDSDFDPES